MSGRALNRDIYDSDLIVSNHHTYPTFMMMVSKIFSLRLFPFTTIQVKQLKTMASNSSITDQHAITPQSGDSSKGSTDGGATSSHHHHHHHHRSHRSSAASSGIIKTATGWFQRKINLRPAHRGCHLITDEVVKQIPELSQFKVGVCTLHS